MIIVDRLLTAPFRGLLWVFDEICHAAEEELEAEAEVITSQLHQLYVALEGGKITEEEFDTRETELLDRLESIQEREEQTLTNDENDEGDYDSEGWTT